MRQPGFIYEILDASTGDVLSRRTTRAEALAAWRKQEWRGQTVQIWRRSARRGSKLN